MPRESNSSLTWTPLFLIGLYHSIIIIILFINWLFGKSIIIISDVSLATLEQAQDFHIRSVSFSTKPPPGNIPISRYIRICVFVYMAYGTIPNPCPTNMIVFPSHICFCFLFNDTLKQTIIFLTYALLFLLVLLEYPFVKAGLQKQNPDYFLESIKIQEKFRESVFK